MTAESKSRAGQHRVAEVPERPLITLLVVVTFTTGVMDAFSVLGLRHVFTIADSHATAGLLGACHDLVG